MTDESFQKREKDVPAYLDGIYIKDWTDLGKTKQEPEAGKDPRAPRKRAAGEKAAIHFRYCSHQ